MAVVSLVYLFKLLIKYNYFLLTDMAGVCVRDCEGKGLLSKYDWNR